MARHLAGPSIAMKQAIIRITSLLLVAISFTPAILFGNEPDHDALFRIERNKNANIIQYDAQVGANGILHTKQPVVAYWVRLAEQGQVKKLTWMQRKFAFGFTTKLHDGGNTVALDLVLKIGRTIMVEQHGKDYRAITQINGVDSYLDKIFIQATGKGIATRVDYIELFGSAVNNREQQFERITHTR